VGVKQVKVQLLDETRSKDSTSEILPRGRSIQSIKGEGGDEGSVEVGVGSLRGSCGRDGGS